MMQIILREEMSYVGARILDGQGVHMIGPCMMVHGTEEQKKRFLPPISKCEVIWAQGFSEPNAGSDLAGLQLRAVKDGDDYILNGQKTWTSYGTVGDWIHVLPAPTRTRRSTAAFLLRRRHEVEHHGHAYRQHGGFLRFTDTYFDNVRVPRTR
jgi:alkylation response protein AidB-like acyl-CoA dehydrogenase